MSRHRDKIAFIHFAKAAGRYVNRYLRERVFKNGNGEIAEQQYKIFNSWGPPFSMGRDWNQAELLQLANNRHPGQYPTPQEILAHHRCWNHDYLAKQYVHNHHYEWTQEAVSEFRRNGWLTFMFVRDPAELLCSVWTWARGVTAKGGQPVIQPPGLVEQPLDDFIREVVGTPGHHNIYALPDFVEQIDYTAEFSEENFRGLLRIMVPDHEYDPGSLPDLYRRASGNPGYAEYRRRRQISDQTHDMLNDDIDVQRVRDLIERSVKFPD